MNIMLSLLIAWELQFCLAKPLSSTFIASFQPSGQWSSTEWIEYKGKIPALTQFTACHWEKLPFHSVEINTVWSYCHYMTKTDSRLKCVELYERPGSQLTSSVGKDIDLVGWIDGWTDYTIYIEFLKIPYKHRRWNHFCWSYCGATGINKAYHNGELIGTVSLLDTFGSHEFIMPGTDNSSDSAFIIGQEPDSMRGGYTKSQAFPGEISELNIWNKILDDDQIVDIANCEYKVQGNVVAWDKPLLDVNDAIIIDVEDSTVFCQDTETFFIIPEKMSFSYGKTICSIYGFTYPFILRK